MTLYVVLASSRIIKLLTLSSLLFHFKRIYTQHGERLEQESPSESHCQGPQGTGLGFMRRRRRTVWPSYVLFFNIISVVCCTHGRLLSVFLGFTIHLHVRRSLLKGFGHWIIGDSLLVARFAVVVVGRSLLSTIYLRSWSHLLATINQKAF